MLSVLLAVALAAAPGPKKVKLAVLDVEDVSGTVPAQARLMTQIAVSEVSQEPGLDVISSNEVRSLLGLERQRQLLGCKEDSACLAEIGGALGVDYIITGQLGRLGNRYRLDVRLLDARKAKLVASVGQFLPGNDDALGDAGQLMVRKLLVQGKLRRADAEPVGGLSASQSLEAPSRTPAYVALGATAVMATGAVLMTLKTRSTYSDAQKCYADPSRPLSECKSGDASLSWSGPLADALWAGTAVGAGLSAYFFLRAPDSSGSGGELGVGGRF